jgi:hypothetical protein
MVRGLGSQADAVRQGRAVQAVDFQARWPGRDNEQSGMGQGMRRVPFLKEQPRA